MSHLWQLKMSHFGWGRGCGSDSGRAMPSDGPGAEPLEQCQPAKHRASPLHGQAVGAVPSDNVPIPETHRVWSLQEVVRIAPQVLSDNVRDSGRPVTESTLTPGVFVGWKVPAHDLADLFVRKSRSIHVDGLADRVAEVTVNRDELHAWAEVLELVP